MKPCKPAISWPGGKTRMLKHLLPLVPEHRLYVEVFGGGAALLLAKPKAPVEVYNDLSGELVAFFRNVKHHLPALLEELEFIQNGRQEMKDFLAQPGLTEIQRVARWFVCNKISFGAQGESFGTSRTGAGASHGSRANRLKALRNLNERLDSVCVEHLSWEKLLPLYDTADTLFFLDPPYFAAGGPYGAFTEDDFLRLAAAIEQLKGRWILTFQDHQLVRDRFSAFHQVAVTRQKGIENRRGSREYRELIVTSHPAAIAKAA